MRKIKKISVQKFDPDKDPFYSSEKVASVSECTGLIPSAVQNEDEAEAYSELYALHEQPPQKKTDFRTKND